MNRYRDEISTARVYVSMFEAEVSPLMQKVMDRFPNVYLKAYVSLRNTEGNSMPIDFVSTSSESIETEEQLESSINFFRELVVEAGKSFSYDE